MALGDDGDIARLATRIEFLIEDVKTMKADIGAMKPSLSTLESEVGHLRREVEQYRASAMLNRPLNSINTTQMAWFMLAFIGIAVAIVLAVYFGGQAG